MKPEDSSIDANLREQLRLQWQDHIQTRQQTWKAVEITSLLAIAIVGIDWKIENRIITIIGSILLIIAAHFALSVVIHHRNHVESPKFEVITEIEKRLNIYNPKIRIPQPVAYTDIFNIKRSNTSLFMMRILFIIQIFAVVLLIFRIFFS